MTISVLNTYGFYSPNHSILKKLKCPPCERDVFGKIAGLISKLGKAFICLKEFSKDLNYTRESISRAITGLEKKSLIRRVGIKYLGFYPYVEILPLPETAGIVAPLTNKSTSIDHLVNERYPNGQTEEIRKQININKQTTKPAENFVVAKHIKTPEEEALSKLVFYGVGKNTAKRWLSGTSLEIINAQLANLEGALKTGTKIRNKPAWLCKAIQVNFSQSPALEQTALEDQESAQLDLVRKADQILNSAKRQETLGNLGEAKIMAEKSLQVKASQEGEEFLARINKSIANKRLLNQIKKSMPKEELAKIYFEELAKQKTLLHRLGVTKMGKFHHMAAKGGFNERLLSNFSLKLGT